MGPLSTPKWVRFPRRSPGERKNPHPIFTQPSTPLALYVSPLLVQVSYLFGRPMDLVFTASEVTAVVRSRF